MTQNWEVKGDHIPSRVVSRSPQTARTHCASVPSSMAQTSPPTAGACPSPARARRRAGRRRRLDVRARRGSSSARGGGTPEIRPRPRHPAAGEPRQPGDHGRLAHQEPHRHEPDHADEDHRAAGPRALPAPATAAATELREGEAQPAAMVISVISHISNAREQLKPSSSTRTGTCIAGEIYESLEDGEGRQPGRADVEASGLRRPPRRRSGCGGTPPGRRRRGRPPR